MSLVTDGVRRVYAPDDCAIRTLLGEAANQGQVGMLAVAGVIRNRLEKQNYFGMTIAAVCRLSQFNGFDTATLKTSLIYGEAAEVWSMACSGVDITQDALFYANPIYSEAQWAKNLSLKNALQIGAHFFTDNIDGVPFHAAGQTISLEENISSFLGD